MCKQIRFTDNDADKNLIAEIKAYQKAHGLSSFIGHCHDALEISKIQR